VAKLTMPLHTLFLSTLDTGEYINEAVDMFSFVRHAALPSRGIKGTSNC
jgi:hypothetical protein